MSAIEDALRARIAAAFAGEPPAPPVERMLLAAYRESDDACEIAQAFAGKRWADLSIDQLFHHREMVVTLSAEAYRAILPAYLTAALADDPRRRGDLREYLVFGLAPLSDEPLDVESTRERLAGLAPVQRDAVRAVLTYLVEDTGMPGAAEVLRTW